VRMPLITGESQRQYYQGLTFVSEATGLESEVLDSTIGSSGGAHIQVKMRQSDFPTLPVVAGGAHCRVPDSAAANVLADGWCDWFNSSSPQAGFSSYNPSPNKTYSYGGVISGRIPDGYRPIETPGAFLYMAKALGFWPTGEAQYEIALKATVNTIRPNFPGPGLMNIPWTGTSFGRQVWEAHAATLGIPT
uniref:hypothetical protein n=1 Tax=Neotabrizicola sp. sgz301269 TaxID=3276282 RepID=UPI0037700859